MGIESAKNLTAYKKGCELAMACFQIIRSFPPDERFALTGQIRRRLPAPIHLCASATLSMTPILTHSGRRS